MRLSPRSYGLSLHLLLAGLPASALGASGDPALSTQEVYAAARDKVVLIRTEEGTGAGFLIQGRRLIATAFHVVQAGGKITVHSRAGGTWEARVYSYDKENDLAILELNQDFSTVEPLRLRSSGELSIGEPVVVIGHPFGRYSEDRDELKGLLTWTVTSGVLGAISQTVLQTDAAINPGNSGGPVLDGHGFVVGVVSSQLKDASNVGFAVRSEQLDLLLVKKSSPPLPTPPVLRGGVALTRTSTLYGTWANGLSLNLERRPRGSGLRHEFSLGYSLVDEMPDDGQLFNFREEYFQLQYDLGYHLHQLHLDVLAGLTAGWRNRQSIHAVAQLADPGCDLNTNDCPLNVTFEKTRANGPRLAGVAGVKLVQLFDVMDVGAGVVVDAFTEPYVQWRLWLAFLDKS